MSGPERGLQSIREGREARQRGRYTKTSPNVVLMAVAAAALVLLGYRFYAGRKLEGARSELLQKRNAARATVGAEWVPLKAQLEKHTMEAGAADYAGDYVAPEAKSWDFRALPGVYLRLRREDTHNAAAIRAAAEISVKDAFTGCLLRSNAAPLPVAPAPAGSAAVNDLDAGATGSAGFGLLAEGDEPIESPWNLKDAYRATRILTDGWEKDVRDASDELRLRIFEQQYEKAKNKEIPLAVDIIKRAKFYMFLVDEDVPGVVPEMDAGGVQVSDLELVRHPVRVNIVNLKTNQLMVRLRRSVEAEFRVGAGAVILPEEAKRARQRQGNNCLLATEVWKALR
ncbi:MAG: hypothetical protein U0174_02365 [Polyangiaceae bacterium]